MRIYAVAATRNTPQSSGWSSSIQLPMFYLHSGTQGILNEDHASQIATVIVGEPATAYDVTSDMPENADLLADNARLRALLASMLESRGMSEFWKDEIRAALADGAK